MLLCLDYAANYNEKVRLPPPITAYILLYISVYMAVFCIYWGWSAESGLLCGQVDTKSYAPKYLDGKRIQTVDTYYSVVGILDELTPEEMEEVFQKSLAERKKTETA